MRKENDFDIMDRIKITGATGSVEIRKTCERYGEDIKREILANKLDIKYSKEKQEGMKDWYITGKEVFLEVKIVR